MAAAGCTEPTVPVTVPFVATWGNSPISCSQAAGSQRMNDLRFYVSDIEFLADTGAAQSLTLDRDGSWQTARVALVDLEDGSGACDNGTPAVNTELRGQVAAGAYTGIRFVVGVPFEDNHADPLAAAAPLDDAAMHWHWRSGYKFLRAGVEGTDDGFWVHLGSAGCKGTVGNIERCSFPNRVVVELRDFEAGRDRIAFDFERLLSGTALDDAAPGDCSSGPAESACVEPFARLGIDHATGDSVASQSVWRVAEK